MTSTLKALVELHAMSVEGLNAKLTVETAENPFGGGGQVQEDPTDVKEERPNISFKFEEKYGMPIFNFFRYWITGLIMDPQTKVATLQHCPTGLLICFRIVILPQCCLLNLTRFTIRWLSPGL